jgi:glycine cleavage system H protein
MKMKDINKLTFPSELRYTGDHFWLRHADDILIIGITDYAQNQLGDLIFLDLPEEGDTFERGEEFGAVESTKAAVDLFMPLSGEIVKANQALSENPQLANTSPYGDGWLIEIKPANMLDFEGLMDAAAYLNMLDGLE